MYRYNNCMIELVTEQSGEGFYLAQYKTAYLAIFSYYVESQMECVLIDPVFDVHVYRQMIETRKSKLKYVLLTHYHADFLSGHNEFNVPIIMGPKALRPYNTYPIKETADGQTITLGLIKLKTIHTPGHTLESSCYQLIDGNNKDIALFTGDTVFLGEVGRPDLACGADLTSEDLAGMLYDSIQKVRKLQGSMRVYPAHGAGSACGKSIGAGNYCTLERQNTNNYGFKFNKKQDFVKELTRNLGKPPKYFFYDSELNQKGIKTNYEEVLKKTHVRLSQQEFLKNKDVYPLLDTRANPEGGFVKGAYWLSNTGPLCSFISHFIEPQQEFILICDPEKEIPVYNRLFRIGYFNIKGYTDFDISQVKEVEKHAVRNLNFETLKQVKEPTHLDVRNKPEYLDTGILEGAITIPLPELQARIGQLKDKKNIVINCLSGVRSKMAHSILAKHNIESQVLSEELKKFKENGLKMVDYKE